MPQIDPITFSALSMLDGFVAKAQLTRQEHAEANKSLQHLVQTVEMLQATVKELMEQNRENSEVRGKGQKPDLRTERSTVPAETAEEAFKIARGKT